MKISFDYIKPYRAGQLEIKYAPDGSTIVCCVNGYAWMGYNPTNQIAVKQLFAEVELAYGHCLVTGLGLGLRETQLLQKPEVTKVTVVERCQDIADWYFQVAKEAGLPVEKLEILIQDANTVEGVDCDCLYLDHYEFEAKTEIISTSKAIAQKNPHKVFWFWSLLEVFANWAHANKRKIDATSFQQWAQEVGLDGMLPTVDDEFIRRNTRHYFGLSVEGARN